MTAQTLTLTQFLIDRISEDEEAAREADITEPRYGVGNFGDTAAEECIGMGWSEGVADQGMDHFSRWLPARVLAECAAKRRIAAMWHEAVIDDDGSDDSEEVLRHPTDESHTGWVMALWDTMRALASVYADHPLYRAEWKL